MGEENYNLVTYGDSGQADRRRQRLDLVRNCPIPDGELLLNMGLFLVPQTLSRILFMDFLYRQILDVQGIVMDFGCRWGQNALLFTAMRGIYEPFNRLRKVVAFDTFGGFPGISAEDGNSQMMSTGSYSVTEGYEQYLAKLLELQEAECPLEHISKHEICKGDATVEVADYLQRNRETIVALAYFDFDLYEPTKEVLQAIQPRLTRGSVIGFDELNDPDCPGETLAVIEVLGLDRYAIKRFPYNSRTSYLVVE
ncbi:hypothetical protein LCGC14_0018170 [marine sediment metagenome]|uniref:Crotonobetainyl-CoA--carnitine CoA-transferase n=1 Tax=marine sediment metagenome TaxID=412755 RepID=A0A0F9W229_9ZZZZ|nr:crotonobetainyl-CoA--carnitine CoA-transferase [Phycisphaerae bacterium]HDZ42909.1 crotonobetainyl-CoA--carnitine CoA-transferase [Phycisphaerae bacterium]